MTALVTIRAARIAMLAGAVTVATVGAERQASAQPSSRPSAEAGSTQAVARELYEAGVRAAEAERWSEAADAFARSHALTPTTPALANLAAAQIALGRYVAARQTLDRLLAAPDLSDAHRTWGERARADASAQIGSIVFLGAVSPSSVRVTLDGRDAALQPHAEAIGAVEVDPGEHTVQVETAGAPPRTEQIAIEAGLTESIHVLAAAPPSADRTTTAPTEATGARADDGSIFSHPLFWTGVGATLVGIGVAILLVVTATPEDQRLIPRTDEVHHL